MKKLIKNILFIILLIVLAIVTILLGSGYNLYSKKIKEQSIDSKIKEIQEKPNYTKLDDISETYKNAVVAVEDHRFYIHKGIDIIGIGRAIVRNISQKELVEGGSTIAQQLAKNTYFPKNKKMDRKVAEIFMACKYEKELDKSMILELYANTSYFGNGYYDIGSASKGYFDKNPSELNDYEATMLAGVPNAPSVYAPTVNFELASQRQEQVLDKMVKYNYISNSKRDEIISQKEKYQNYFNSKR